MNKLLTILFLLILSANNFAESVVRSYTLNWTGVEKWVNTSQSIQVLAFDGSVYPTENHLPYFSTQFSVEHGFTYRAKVKNEVYAQLSANEATLIAEYNFSNQFELSSNINSFNNNFQVQVLPFAQVKGIMTKLISFDLEIEKVPSPQKSPSATQATYLSSSILSTGKFVKIGIAETGVHKITYEKIVSLGLDPDKIHVYGHGGYVLEESFADANNQKDDLPEIAIYKEKGNDGIFGSGDYILFYGRASVRWTYDSSKLMFTHLNNPYSKYGYYFLTSNTSTTKEIGANSVVIPSGAAIDNVSQFIDYKVYEKNYTSLTKGGKEFFGDKFSSTTAYKYGFNFPNTVLASGTKARMDVIATASAASVYTLSLDGTAQSTTLSIPAKSSDVYEYAKQGTVIFPFTPVADSLTLNVSYAKPAAISVGYMNFIELNARRKLIMTGSVMQFQNVDGLGLGHYNQFVLSGANSNTQIWDITDPLNITRMQTELSNDTLRFMDSGNVVKSYIAIDPTSSASLLSTVSEVDVPNQNLHAIQQADMVIITHPNFVSPAQTLASAHRTKDNLTVEVLTTEQVYNEFSSGAPDATAYRRVLKMLYDRAGSTVVNRPKYLLLFGRGTYDNKKELLEAESGDNFVLTYQADKSTSLTGAYTTDDYFTFMEDSEGTNIPSHSMDLGVGRFPVINLEQANIVVDKTISYMNNSDKGAWKNQICFLADDGDAALHMRHADTIASSIGRTFKSLYIHKLHLDATMQETSASGESYPLIKRRFDELINSGLLYINFTGHGSPVSLTNEKMLNLDDIIKMSNKHYPFFWGATCDFMQYDIKSISAGENLLLKQNGGCIGVVSATRPVYASQNLKLNRFFGDNIFKKVNGEQQRIGDVIKFAKNSVGTEVNKLSYTFIGDPALKLNVPSKYQVITKKINEHTVFGNDTLKALSVATIQGYVADLNGDTVTNFNGTVHAIVLDKLQKIVTLNNHKDGFLTYYDRTNTLFAGDAVVKNGKFVFSFMLPRDLKYNFGTGSVNYYAQDNTNDLEAQGYFDNFVVGGIDANFTAETDGPAVQMYLNDSLVVGNKVNEAPLFFANLSDVHGINSSGTGIGRELQLVVDQDPLQTYNLNDYYAISNTSYTKGSINFKMPEMVEGKHTLSFRAWDLMGNSTLKNLDFEVVKGLAPTVFSVSNYPNPVISSTRFLVKNDRPDAILSSKVEVYDIAGALVWKSASSTNVDNVSWNLVGLNGHKVSPGVYFYKVVVQVNQNEFITMNNKMIVVR